MQLKLEKRNAFYQRLKSRITEIDLLRGIVVIIMMLDHVAYYFGYNLPSIFYNFPNKYQFTIELANFSRKFWNWQVRVNVRYFILMIFLLLTGISCSFSRNNLKRGIKLMIVALFISVVTYVFGKIIQNRQVTIIFGILHCIALSIILIAGLELLLQKVPNNEWIYLALGLVMVVVGAVILFIYPKIQFGFYGDEPFIPLLLKSMVGILETGSDCYSLLFYGGQIFIGVFIGKRFYKDKKSLFFKGEYKNNLITFIGRHSLFFYISHQVVFLIVFSIILLCFGFTFNI